jgi:hypothetical protein
MAQLQDIWNKFNPRERLSAIGAGVIIIGYVLSLPNYGVGGSVIAVVAGIAVAVILYLKYANPAMVWPAPVSLIVLAISGITALFVLLGFLSWIGVLGIYGGLTLGALLVTVVGTAIMTWGAWQEYQIVKPAMPNFGATTTPTTPAAPPAHSAPVDPAPAAPPDSPAADDTDEAPPA